MNNTIEHLSCGGFAVLPVPQAVPVLGQQAALHVLASHDAGFEILNEPTQKRS